MTSDIIALPDAVSLNEGRPLYLFVCTGNTCRSPMAAALFAHKYSHIADSGSCGVSASGRTPIAKEAAEALRLRGVAPDLFAGHISRRATDELLDSADKIICMTGDHARYVILHFPSVATKVFAMPEDIFDPFGCDLATYNRALDQIEQGLDVAFGSPVPTDETDVEGDSNE